MFSEVWTFHFNFMTFKYQYHMAVSSTLKYLHDGVFSPNKSLFYRGDLDKRGIQA